MNPYYPNQYPYPNQPIQYGYGQGAYLEYQPQNQAPNFSAVYTLVQPYNSKQFLINTFGNRPDFINVFNSLPHEDKLMLYVCTEQKRMYGQIKNKEAYQRLLKDIAQKVQNYNNFHHANKEQPQSKEEQKNKQLQHKIDDIVEKTFEKLNLSNLAQNQSQSLKECKHEEVLLTEQDEDQEWVEPEEQSQPQQINSIQPQQMSLTAPQPQALNGPIFNMFTFDSQIQQALTQQIGLKPATEKKSIWQLDLAQQQVRMSEPNLKQIFKSKPSQIAVNDYSQDKENLFFSQSVSKPGSQLQDSHYSQPTKLPSKTEEQYRPFPMHLPNENNSQLQGLWQSYPQKDHSIVHSLTQWVSQASAKDNQPSVYPNGITQIQKPFNNTNSDKMISQGANTIGNKGVLQITQPKFKQEHNKEQLLEGTIQKQKETFEQTLVQVHQQYQSNPITAQIYATQNIITPNHQLDFDLLDGFSSTTHSHNSAIKNDLTPIDIPSTNEPLLQALQMNDIVVQASELNFEAQQGRSEVLEVLSPRRQQLLPFRTKAEDYSLIETLKIEFDPKVKQMIEKQLKSKSFECDTQFYLRIINYLEQIALKESLQFQHFKQQYLIVKALHEQTEKYTTAVDQDEEETVASSIKRTKDLYRQIYAHSHQTQVYTNRILSHENQEKGFLYKFGRVLIDSCISHQLLSRVITHETKTQIQESFYVFYVLQKCNSLNSLKMNSQRIIAYANAEYEKYRCLDGQILLEIDRQLENYPKYRQYIKGIVKILEICERMIILLKAVSIKPQANVVKTLKNCKDIKTKYEGFRESLGPEILLPDSYKQAIRQGVEKNKSPYDLHSAFSEAYRLTPVCKICLLVVDQRGAKISQDYCHFACFNLLAQIERQQHQQIR